VQAVFEGRNVTTSAIGTNRDYLDVRAWKLIKGEIWDAAAENIKDKVCVIGTTVRDNLFGTVDPLGQKLRLGRHTYRVIGILESKGQASFGGDQDDVILMPLGTFSSHVSWAPPGTAGALMVSAASEDVTDRAVAQATAILRQRHRIGPGKEPDFSIRSQAEFQATQQSILGALSALLISVAAVSLFVGGIGVMNIMLVSVTERTREIGIRMAIGAREGDILLQFLVEAVVLSLLGGLVGTLLAVGAIFAFSQALEWPMRLPSEALMLALGTSLAIGVVFGFLPARRAARLDPIEALRQD
jgi:putative ABC transport system permease protein